MRPGKALLPFSLVFASACALLFASGAEARSEAEARYSKAQTFSAALRYLRVDLEYEVVEKDADAAYLIFKYAAPGQRQTSTGTMEIVSAADTVRIYVKLPKMPEYHERVLRDGLLRKLREEYGEPPAPKPKPEAPKKPAEGDAGTE
ncbi:MAG TPA: hypothetical protein VM686_17690 [Polyangiaceae bacterium]|jgi:hypothetical protein|nr:hypothetical protein [Polyangiaceae bacterium]